MEINVFVIMFFFLMGFAFCADAVVALLTVGVSMFTQKLQRRKTQ